MAEFGYKRIITAEALLHGIGPVVHSDSERQLERHVADAGLVPQGPVHRETVPLVWSDSMGFRLARDYEEPDAFEFRYLQYAAEVDS